jgi:hypothetical protein
LMSPNTKFVFKFLIMMLWKMAVTIKAKNKTIAKKIR